jgi:hypothetical protein
VQKPREHARPAGGRHLRFSLKLRRPVAIAEHPAGHAQVATPSHPGHPAEPALAEPGQVAFDTQSQAVRTGAMSATVPQAGQSRRWRSDFDLGIVKFRLSQLVFSCLQPSQHPSMVASPVPAPPLPKHTPSALESTTSECAAISNGSLYHQYIVLTPLAALLPGLFPRDSPSYFSAFVRCRARFHPPSLTGLGPCLSACRWLALDTGRLCRCVSARLSLPRKSPSPTQPTHHLDLALFGAPHLSTESIAAHPRPVLFKSRPPSDQDGAKR